MSFVFGANSASTGYNLTRSLRFRASASAYLNRTPSVAGNRKTWTWSGWVKRGTLTGDQAIFFAGTAGNNNTLRFNSDNTMYVFRFDGSITWGLNTTQVFRDPSAWYHVVLAYDSTQATSTNRVKLYINGTQVTAFSSATYPSLNLNSDVNNTVDHRIANNNASNNFDSYQTELNSVDGQALTPSSFGSTNATTGVWQPARYTGTYGTNGFYLPFTDNSALTTTSNVGLGKDFSGNGNYWTTNNISITAGVTYDSMTDVPTLTSATAANFAVLNPIIPNGSASIVNGNLGITPAGTYCNGLSTIQLDSGSYYAECTVTTAQAMGWGIWLNSASTTASTGTTPTGFYGIYSGGATLMLNGSAPYTNAGASPSSGDIVQVAWSNGKVWFGKNNTWYDSTFGTTGNPSTGANPIVSGLSVNAFAIAFCGANASPVLAANFGQRPFTYTPPTGFVSLNTYNLPTSTILQGNKVMDATLYTGAGNTSSSFTNAAAFKPDLVWTKARSIGYSNYLYDSVRGTGTTKSLVSNTTNAEGADATNANLTAFNSNGWSIGSTAGTNALNNSGQTFVAWQWQAGQGSSSSNTNGSITSTVSVNASAGFSVVTYTGTGANATVGHGLGVAPSWIVVKQRSGANSWVVYHSGLTSAAWFIQLNSTGGQSNAATVWNSTAPTSSVFSIGTAVGVNTSTATYVAYCWTPIAGYSAFGSYTGNGSTDGTFVYTGFRPKFVMIKETGNVQDWVIHDTSRATYNADDYRLLANSSGAELNTGFPIDELSNGFKLRNSGNGTNRSGGNYIYMCFAETPFKNSLAR